MFPFWMAMMVLSTPFTVDSSTAMLGPFLAQPVVSVIVVADGRPCDMQLLVHQTGSETDRFLVRVFDPNEVLLSWRYVEFVDEETLQEIPSTPGVELRPASTYPDEGGLLLDAVIPLEAPGVYQIRVSRGQHPVSLALALSRDVGYGVSFQNGDYRPWPGQPETCYIYVPPHAESLKLRGGPGSLRDQNGTVQAELLDGRGTADIAIDQTEVVWQWEFPQPSDWRLRAAGFPFILCSSEEAARAIHASVDQLDDGTVVCHRFQRRIAELLPRVLAPEHVGHTEELVTPLADRRDAWLQQPERHAVLIDSFLPMVEHWLRSQNLDPNSHWSGSLDGWQAKVDAPPPQNRWDRFQAGDGLWAGASSHYGNAAAHLALAVLHDAPANPYFGREELLYRAAAAALRDLMALGEDEIWPVIAELDPYPGNMAFALGQKTLPVYGLTASHLSDEIREVWTEGVRHLIDRSFPDVLVTCRNQSSHYLVAFQAFADGSGDPRYRALAQLYARRFVDGQHPTGYHMERIGPDASYIGMTHWHEAVYYRMSGDPVILESIRRSYDLFNHTVAPEPDGKVLGGFNFNHRVGEGFYFEQWGGAQGILDDVLPEVGLWAQTASAEASRERIERFLAEPTKPAYPDIRTPRYLYHAVPDKSAAWPCLREGSFIRTFGDEFIAIKRPRYYAVCYVGKPAGAFYIQDRENFRQPFPGNLEETGGELPEMRRTTPFGGGGLSSFWTPEYGHMLLAANWSPTTHHGLIATRANGNRYWEDYHAHTYALDTERGSLIITGRIEDQPITYERRYQFADEALHVNLTLHVEGDVELQRLVENIPIARGGWKTRGATLVADDSLQERVEASRFQVLDNRGMGVDVQLDEPRELRVVPEGLKTSGWRQLQIGRVEIMLPSSLNQGMRLELGYQIRPTVIDR